MSLPTKVALIGIGGYGHNYVKALLDTHRDDVHFVAAVDPHPNACPHYDQIIHCGIPIYPSIGELYAKHDVDLAVISTPIQFHCDHTVIALEHGSHVLCEKPLCSTPAQIDRMIAARDRAHRHVGIGYQWSFSPTFQNLKNDILAGIFGAPKRLSTFCCWPRGNHYYGRNRWAGRQFDDDGNPVFDSPANNACAHSLHNMFFMLGSALDQSATPQDVTVELYRAHAIPNYDTAAIRCNMPDDIEVLFFTSHVTHRDRGPLMHFEFEKAVVTYDETNSDGVIAKLADGSVRQYGRDIKDVRKLWRMVDSIAANLPVDCGIEAAAAHVRTVAAAQQSDITTFPKDLVREAITSMGRVLIIDNLDEDLLRCYREHKLPSELDLMWASQSRMFKIH